MMTTSITNRLPYPQNGINPLIPGGRLYYSPSVSYNIMDYSSTICLVPALCLGEVAA